MGQRLEENIKSLNVSPAWIQCYGRCQKSREKDSLMESDFLCVADAYPPPVRFCQTR